jgi:hypothetical protein
MCLDHEKVLYYAYIKITNLSEHVVEYLPSMCSSPALQKKKLLIKIVSY